MSMPILDAEWYQGNTYDIYIRWSIRIIHIDCIMLISIYMYTPLVICVRITLAVATCSSGVFFSRAAVLSSFQTLCNSCVSAQPSGEYGND